MRRTFNMGVGMIMVVSPDKVAAVQAECPDAWVLGEVEQGNGVRYV
jgi:phosphoribosylaminoimidazole (AIR) synthetase